MDYPVVLCVCTAAAPFVAMMREVITNRRPWFTSVLVIAGLTFAVMVGVAFVYTRAADSFCYNYEYVVRQLRQCEADFSDNCCMEVEDSITVGCGWNYSRAEFCTAFGEVTQSYCRINYCPQVDLDISVALPPNEQAALVLDE